MLKCFTIGRRYGNSLLIFTDCQNASKFIERVLEDSLFTPYINVERVSEYNLIVKWDDILCFSVLEEYIENMLEDYKELEQMFALVYNNKEDKIHG